MTKKDINDIISVICPNDEDFEKPIISPKYLKEELEQLALEQEPKTEGDCISKRVAINDLKQQAEEMSHWSKRYAEQRKGVLTAINIVSDCPSVNTPEPKTGYWTIREDTTSSVCQFPRRWVECSHCHWNFPYDRIKDAYCSNCGTKMESVLQLL